MPPARPLREVFAALAGDQATQGVAASDRRALLEAAGHSELPADLVAEAVVAYADTAPLEVAEHLAPFVTAHSAVPVDGGDDVERADWFDLLAAAPGEAWLVEPEVDRGPDADPAVDGGAFSSAATTDGAAVTGGATDAGPDLEFGQGAAGDPRQHPDPFLTPDPAAGLDALDTLHGDAFAQPVATPPPDEPRYDVPADDGLADGASLPGGDDHDGALDDL